MYIKNILLFLELMCFGGYPKDPFFGIPLGLFLIIIFWKRYLRLIDGVWRSAVLASVVFSGYMISISLISEFTVLRDIIFSMTMFYKFIANICMAAIIINIINRNSIVLGIYILFQILLIFISAFDFNLFYFLLKFQSVDAAKVFSQIFGIRSSGFGVIHNEGVTLLVLLYLVTTMLQKNRVLLHLNGFLLYFSSLSSRLVVPLIVIVQIIFARKVLLVVAITSLIAFGLYAENVDGPWKQVFELSNGVDNIGSINAIKEMTIVPQSDDLKAWIFGSGKYFDGDEFYMGTDIGFARILLSGGIVGSFLFLYVNFCVVLKNYRKSFNKNIYVLSVFTLIFVISNFKGINILNWFQIVYMYIISNKLFSMKKL